MHELSIAQALVKQAVEVMTREGGQSVTRLSVSVGSLSGVDPDSLEAVFPFAAEETPCRGAAISIELVEARVFCRVCDRETDMAFPCMACRECDSSDVTLVAGRELTLESVEIEA